MRLERYTDATETVHRYLLERNSDATETELRYLLEWNTITY